MGEIKVLELLKTKYSSTPTTLWQWQMLCPLEERWANFIGANTEFGNFVSQGGSQKREDLAVLDRGCGFGMYWPILTKLGFKKFVGIDLFDLRISRQFEGMVHIKQTLSLLLHGKPRATLRSLRPRPKTENYLDAAHDFVQAMCPEIEYQLIEGDVCNIDNYELKFNPFDLICAYSVNSTKF